MANDDTHRRRGTTAWLVALVILCALAAGAWWRGPSEAPGVSPPPVETPAAADVPALHEVTSPPPLPRA